MYHGDAKETFDPDPWLVPLPSLRRGIPATPSTGALGLLGVVWCSHCRAVLELFLYVEPSY